MPRSTNSHLRLMYIPKRLLVVVLLYLVMVLLVVLILLLLVMVLFYYCCCFCCFHEYQQPINTPTSSSFPGIIMSIRLCAMNVSFPSPERTRINYFTKILMSIFQVQDNLEAQIRVSYLKYHIC